MSQKCAGTDLCPPPRTSPCFFGPAFAQRTWYAFPKIRPKVMSQMCAGSTCIRRPDRLPARSGMRPVDGQGVRP